MNPNPSEEFEDELGRLKQENEIKRMKLRLEYGANFPIESNQDGLSPEVESQFLDHVMEFEKAFHSSEQIKVYDFIGNPEYKKSEDIPDSEINEELDRIMDLLHENQIDLATLCEVDSRELYRFITEELFFHEIDNIKMEGWISHFTYEEFHPNHEYDLKNYCFDFFDSFLNQESTFYTNNLTKEAEENKWFENFRNSFISFRLNKLEVLNIQFDEINAKVEFDIDFSGVIEDSNETAIFSGKGEMDFLFQWDYWYINKVTIPSNSGFPSERKSTGS